MKGSVCHRLYLARKSMVDLQGARKQSRSKKMDMQRKEQQRKYEKYLRDRLYAKSSAKDWPRRIYELDTLCVKKRMICSEGSLYDLDCPSCLNIALKLKKGCADEVKRPHNGGRLAALNHYCEFLLDQKLYEGEEIDWQTEKLQRLMSHLGWNRNSCVRSKALHRAHYKCELDVHHSTFLNKSTNRPYAEVHHLIPLECQNNPRFAGKELDCILNVIVLCPNCHRLLHYGSKKDVRQALSLLPASRRKILERFGISIQELVEINLKERR